MTPTLNGIDHAHFNVADIKAAQQWYGEVLGFRQTEALQDWATGRGPYTLQDKAGTVHIALFESDGPASESSIAYGTDGASFLEWKAHLEEKGLKLRLADHDLAYSLYFHDPWDNYHEITTYERDHVAKALDSQ